MNMTLKSFSKFQKYTEKISKQRDLLYKAIDVNKEALQTAQLEYTNIFVEGSDTSSVSKKIQSLKNTIQTLEDELNIIDSADLREKELAGAVLNEYNDLKKTVLDERTRLWQQAEKIKIDAKESIKKLNDQYLDLANEFNREVAIKQLSQIINHLDADDNRKANLRRETDGMTAIPGYITIPNIDK